MSEETPTVHGSTILHALTGVAAGAGATDE
jgi:hypothetical protein